jgi:hypothetical protein
MKHHEIPKIGNQYGTIHEKNGLSWENREMIIGKPLIYI